MVAQAPTATRASLKTLIYFRRQSQPRPQDSLSVTLATLPCYPTTLNLRMPSVNRVSLADCFALWGKCTGGLPPPAIQRPSYGRKPSGCTASFYLSTCASAHATVRGMPRFRNNLQQHCATHYLAAGMVNQAPAATHAPLYVRRYFRRQCSPVRRTVSQ